MTLRDRWEEQAHSWARWTRTPGHDVYEWYAPAFLELLPPPAGPALEVGCGEGRVCRDLRAAGYDVRGIDASPTLVALAAGADPDGVYEVGDAMELAFDDGAFDLILAYNALMDFDDMPRAVAEATRVLRPGGHFAVCVTHPIMNAARFDTDEPDAPLVIEGSYLATQVFEDVFERDGLTMHFHGMSYPIEAYVSALEHSGLVIEALREPAMPDGLVDQAAYRRRWQRIPMFLMWRARKLASR